MVNSYDDIMGEPMDVSTHPAHNVPNATQHYAGDVVDGPSGGAGEDSRAVQYAVGNSKDPKVLPMPMTTNSAWARRTIDRRK